MCIFIQRGGCGLLYTGTPETRVITTILPMEDSDRENGRSSLDTSSGSLVIAPEANILS